jgi:hypothetical protein
MSQIVQNLHQLNEPEPTPLQRSACYFVAALAQDIDAKRGIVTQNGTKETQARVIASVQKNCFGDDAAGKDTKDIT